IYLFNPAKTLPGPISMKFFISNSLIIYLILSSQYTDDSICVFNMLDKSSILSLRAVQFIITSFVGLLKFELIISLSIFNAASCIRNEWNPPLTFRVIALFAPLDFAISHALLTASTVPLITNWFGLL